LALLAVLLCFGGFGLALGEVVVSQVRLGQVADEAARAGAYAALAGLEPCAIVARFVADSVDSGSVDRGSVRVARCEGADAITVTLTAPSPRFLQPFLADASLHATARAGS
jgi:hypothetical protein